MRKGSTEHSNIELEWTPYGVKYLGDSAFVKEKLLKWLSVYSEVQFVSDVCHYDMVLLINLFGDAFSLPKWVSAVCHDINQDIAKSLQVSDSKAFDVSRESLLDKPIEGDKHNALYDANVIRAIYNKIV